MIPIDFHIFSEGVETTNQMMFLRFLIQGFMITKMCKRLFVMGFILTHFVMILTQHHSASKICLMFLHDSKGVKHRQFPSSLGIFPWIFSGFSHIFQYLPIVFFFNRGCWMFQKIMMFPIYFPCFPMCFLGFPYFFPIFSLGSVASGMSQRSRRLRRSLGSGGWPEISGDFASHGSLR